MTAQPRPQLPSISDATDATDATSTPDTELHGLTTMEIKALTTSALEARGRAYCPYSHFRVGCALLLRTAIPPTAAPGPLLITGANVENAAYPVGSCAERVALCTAVVQHGIRRGDVRAVGISVDLKREEGRGGASPCGMCRQALREFCDADVPIFLYWGDGQYVVRTMGELLPWSFGPESLPPPQELPDYAG